MLKRFAISFLRSFGQIMLQKSAVTGFMFMIGIGLSSPMMLIGAVVATLSGLATAKLYQYDTDSIHNGLCGFNAALVGIAVFFFLTPSVLSLGLLILGGALSTVIMNFMVVFRPGILPFTFPFL